MQPQSKHGLELNNSQEQSRTGHENGEHAFTEFCFFATTAKTTLVTEVFSLEFIFYFAAVLLCLLFVCLPPPTDAVQVSGQGRHVRRSRPDCRGERTTRERPPQ